MTHSGPEWSGNGGLRSGDRIGKYQIVRRIGEGGMATIYLATSVGPGGFAKPCALKVIRPEFSERPESRQMLVQEARIAALLNHPHVVQVFDLGHQAQHYFMAMEWVDGLALNRLLALLARQDRFLSTPVVALIGAAISEALAYLSQGVVLDGERISLVHRDVSPSNVLISGAGAVKLADFGIVKILEAPTHTRVGVVKGKYAYMSPEQLRGDPVDHRADVFSLGVVLFEALTSHRLFHRKNLAATVAAVNAARVPAPSSINPAVPPGMDAIVLKAVNRDPALRFQSATEIVDALSAFVTTGGRGELLELMRELGPKDEVTSVRPSAPSTPSLPAVSSVDEIPSVVADEHGELAQLDPSDEPPTGYADDLDDFDAQTKGMSLLPGVSRPVTQETPSSTPSAFLFGSATASSSPSRWLPAVIVVMALVTTFAFWWVVLGT